MALLNPKWSTIVWITVIGKFGIFSGTTLEMVNLVYSLEYNPNCYIVIYDDII